MDEEFNEYENEEISDTKEFVIPDENEIVDVTEEEYESDLTSFPHEADLNEPLDLIVDKKKKAKKERKPLTKKQKIIIISVSIAVVLIIALILFFVFKKDKKEGPQKDNSVIIEKDNYRYENGKLVILGSDDKELGSYACKNKDEKKCHVAYSAVDDGFDINKYVYEDNTPVSRVLPVINDQFVFIYDSKKEKDGMIIYYDLKENKKVETYNSVKFYQTSDQHKYLSIENDESAFGLFEITETELKELIAFKYDNLSIIPDQIRDNGYLVTEKANKYYIVDKTGKEISKGISYPIKSFNKNYIVVLDSNDLYTVVDYKNNKVFNKTYDYIKLLDSFAVVVNNKTSLSVIDFDETILNVNPITIPNTYYNKTYIYNDKNKLISENESFWVLDNKDTITVEYYKDETNVKSNIINVYEGVVSKKYSYISYYDGVLYFYDDESKNNLIGTYKCSNKNIIEDESATYNRCYLAKESNLSDNEINSKDKTLGYLPIINKRFVFIYDSISDDKNNIFLYDLVNKKSLGNYTIVDAGIYSGNDGAGFVNENSLLFIGKSAKKDKFGLVELDDSATGVLGMEYTSLERIGDYFLGLKSTGTYQLFDKNGTSVSSEYSGKIVDYINNSYLKTKNSDNTYSVYSFKGSEIASKRNYIDLYSSYFVEIDTANKLHVYEYSAGNVEIGLGVDLKVEDHSKSYGISYSGGIYSVKVFDEAGSAETITLP